MQFDDRLDELLTPDFNLYQAIRARGGKMFLEPDAVVAHENFLRVRFAMRAYFVYARLLSSRRAHAGRWSLGRRIFYGLAVLPGAPAVGLWRLYGGLIHRRSLVRRFLAAMPVAVMVRVFAAFGESAGYLFGPADSAEELNYWESVAERSGR